MRVKNEFVLLKGIGSFFFYYKNQKGMFLNGRRKSNQLWSYIRTEVFILGWSWTFIVISIKTDLVFVILRNNWYSLIVMLSTLKMPNLLCLNLVDKRRLLQRGKEFMRIYAGSLLV